jgi:hypothetical protein
MDHIFARKEDGHLVPAVRLVTIWLGTPFNAVELDADVL